MEHQVARKLEYYKINDLTRHKCNGIFPLESAIEMVKSTEGICVDCQQPLELDGWEPHSLRQFSFDRLNDHYPHSTANCRVICLGCNIAKAKKQYNPNGKHLRKYLYTKKQFFRLTRLVKCKMLIGQMQAYLHQLHALTFPGTRKNNWPTKYSAMKEFEFNRLCDRYGLTGSGSVGSDSDSEDSAGSRF